VDRLERITKLVAEKAASDADLKTLKEQIAQESAAIKKARRPRQKKERQNV
jgi:hypothetical protein